MRARGSMAVVCLAGIAACGGPGAPPGEGPLVVSAAMSLRQVLVDIGQVYETDGGGRVAFNFGPSNSLARQIIEGGPVDVFVSADEAQMQAAEAAGAILADTRIVLLSNQLVVIVPADRAERLTSVQDLADPRFARIAVGDPDAVPVGVYARQYLGPLGLWAALEPRLVPVTSVRAAVGAVENGGADAAFVYRTDAGLSARVTIAFGVPLDEGPSIRYPAAIVRATRRPDAAGAFLRYLGEPAARAIFEQQGFLVVERTGGG